jgi:L-serine deaminase
MNAMTSLWARTGLLWFLATMIFGMYLGMTQQFGASSPHAHLGLLGWLSSIAFAFLWRIADPEGRLVGKARIHWVMHNLGMVVQVSGLWMVIRTGNGVYGMVIALGGATIILATFWLVFLLWGRLVPR